MFRKSVKNDNVENHKFYDCERLVNYSMPQPALGFWHNIELYHCFEDGNYYACCDMRLLGIRVENTVVRCKSEEVGRKICSVMDYNGNYVDFRNHPEDQGCYLISTGADHTFEFEFFGPNDSFYKMMRLNNYRDKFIGDKAELK